MSPKPQHCTILSKCHEYIHVCHPKSFSFTRQIPNLLEVMHWINWSNLWGDKEQWKERETLPSDLSSNLAFERIWCYVFAQLHNFTALGKWNHSTMNLKTIFTAHCYWFGGLIWCRLLDKLWKTCVALVVVGQESGKLFTCIFINEVFEMHQFGVHWQQEHWWGAGWGMRFRGDEVTATDDTICNIFSFSTPLHLSSLALFMLEQTVV